MTDNYGNQQQYSYSNSNGSINGNGNGHSGTPNARSASGSYSNGSASASSTTSSTGGSFGGSYPPQASYSSPTSPYPNIYSPSAMAGTNDDNPSVGLRRRQAAGSASSLAGGPYGSSSRSFGQQTPSKNVVKKLDFMFPKVDKEFSVKAKDNPFSTLIKCIMIFVLATAEVVTWRSQNGAEAEHISVDTTLGRRMRVNLNITFPALACEDLHLDAIDVAGDSQLDVEDTLIKRRLHLNGNYYSAEEIKMETNFHRDQQDKKENLLKTDLPPNYCGPCYGAQQEDGDCCQTCDEVITAYSKKRWKTDLLKFTAEQCVREGRDKDEPKKMTKGQGCNLSGYMTVNRVSGNFHIAMGEGIERDGRHIHTFLPDDAPNFNASHVIHELAFGPAESNEPLNGVSKIVTDESGTTGLFQYFIKVVPTTYVGKDAFPELKIDPDTLPSLFEEGYEVEHDVPTLETNRYFFTERYRPLMTELLEDHHFEASNPRQAAAHAGHGGSHANSEHHKVQNSVLPGVFFIYEIYPFSVEISRSYVPMTHLWIRLMATIGGVITVVRWLDSCMTSKIRR